MAMLAGASIDFAGENISMKFIAPTVASAIDLIVHVALFRDGKRRLTEVSKLTGRIENDRLEVEYIFKWNGESYEKGFGFQIN